MLEGSPLGQTTVYEEFYNPELLYPLPRSLARDKIGVSPPLPFAGVDLWTGYELSWLNPKGKPQIALADFSFPCTSPLIIESKSFKLYLNSFNQSIFESIEDVQKMIEKDLSDACQSQVKVNLCYPNQQSMRAHSPFQGTCLDDLEIETQTYQVQPDFLQTASCEIVEETVFSDLLKSNCLATGQADWGSIQIHYQGSKIDHEGLLKYIISFRRHAGFAEHCTEQIFCDLLWRCSPAKLSVYCRYTRRGGLDINPFRSNFESAPLNLRQIRQ